jgi:uncharacterized protein (TIRG00374 family)
METNQRNNFRVILRVTIGIVIVGVLIWNISAKNLMRSIAQVDFPFLLLAIFYQYTSVLLGSLNQFILFRGLVDLPWKPFTLAYFKAFAIGLILPGRFGDASIGFFLKSEGLNYSQTFSAYILDKYLTFVLYLAILFIFVGSLTAQPAEISILLWAIFAIGLPFIIYLLLRFLSFLPAALRENRLALFTNNLASQLQYFIKHHPFRLVLNFCFTPLKLGLVILCYHAMISALGYDISAWRVGQAALASGIVAFIPVSVQGLGIVEAVALLNFKTLGVSPSDVLACYLILRTSTYVFACIAYGATFFLKNDRGIRFER